MTKQDWQKVIDIVEVLNVYNKYTGVLSGFVFKMESKAKDFKKVLLTKLRKEQNKSGYKLKYDNMTDKQIKKLKKITR